VCFRVSKENSFQRGQPSHSIGVVFFMDHHSKAEDREKKKSDQKHLLLKGNTFEILHQTRGDDVAHMK
jgi:hypothetical protein